MVVLLSSSLSLLAFVGGGGALLDGPSLDKALITHVAHSGTDTLASYSNLTEGQSIHGNNDLA